LNGTFIIAFQVATTFQVVHFPSACLINAPGGRDLYDARAFADCGMELAFLPEYSGPTSSILSRILREHRDDLARDIAR